jgi:hypothetical protein
MRELTFHSDFSSALRAPNPDVDITPLVQASNNTSAGLAIYRNNSRSSFLRVLQETFPVLEKIVGTEFFRYLAHEYYHQCPATAPFVREYGHSMPTFLEGFEPVSKLPYVSDLARLELAWLAAYHAPDAVSLPAEEVIARIGEDPDRALVQLHPSLNLVSSNYQVASLWRHNKTSDAPPPLKLGQGGEAILIVRPDLQVDVHDLSQPLYVFICEIMNGNSLGRAMERVSERFADANQTDLLTFVLSKGLIIEAALSLNT